MGVKVIQRLPSLLRSFLYPPKWSVYCHLEESWMTGNLCNEKENSGCNWCWSLWMVVSLGDSDWSLTCTLRWYYVKNHKSVSMGIMSGRCFAKNDFPNLGNSYFVCQDYVQFYCSLSIFWDSKVRYKKLGMSMVYFASPVAATKAISVLLRERWICIPETQCELNPSLWTIG